MKGKYMEDAVMSENLSSKMQGTRKKDSEINKAGLPSNYGDTK